MSRAQVGRLYQGCLEDSSDAVDYVDTKFERYAAQHAEIMRMMFLYAAYIKAEQNL